MSSLLGFGPRQRLLHPDEMVRERMALRESLLPAQ